MAQYTSKTRVDAVFQGIKPDRAPINVMAGAHCIEQAGVTLEQYLTDPEAALKTAIVCQQMFHSDIVAVPGNPLLGDVQAAMRKLRGDAPTKRRLEDKAAMATLKVKDPHQDRFFGPHLQMCNRCKDVFPDVALQSMIGGPLSAAMDLRGIEEFIYDTVDDPSFAHQLLRFTTELAKSRGKAIVDLGLDIMMADPSAGCSITSPKMFREWVKPYQQEIVSYLKGLGARITLHICGYIDPIMEDLVSLGLDAISLDGPSSLEKLVEISSGKVVIVGNVKTEVFSEGTKAQIEANVKECIDIAAGKGRYILSPGCQIPLNAPLENIRHYVEAGEKFGRYN